MHKNVYICLIKQYFTKDAWFFVQEVLNAKKNIIKYICSMFDEELAKKSSVFCVGCLDWEHINCAGVKHKKKVYSVLQKIF